MATKPPSPAAASSAGRRSTPGWAGLRSSSPSTSTTPNRGPRCTSPSSCTGCEPCDRADLRRMRALTNGEALYPDPASIFRCSGRARKHDGRGRTTAGDPVHALHCDGTARSQPGHAVVRAPADARPEADAVGPAAGPGHQGVAGTRRFPVRVGPRAGDEPGRRAQSRCLFAAGTVQAPGNSSDLRRPASGSRGLLPRG